MTTNKVSSESSFYYQLIHVNNIWNVKTVFMQYGYRLQWYGILPLFLIQYLAQLGLLLARADKKNMRTRDSRLAKIMRPREKTCVPICVILRFRELWS